jgi:hypothetical protein
MASNSLKSRDGRYQLAKIGLWAILPLACFTVVPQLYWPTLLPLWAKIAAFLLFFAISVPFTVLLLVVVREQSVPPKK